MKKIITLIGIGILSLSFLVGCGKKSTITTKNAKNQTMYSYNELDDNTIQIVSYNGNKSISELTIPSEIDGKVVSKIGDYSFDNLFNGDICMNIIVPDTVIEIGIYAFANNQAINEVIFNKNSNISIINAYAFINCTKLNSISYGDSSILPLSLIAIGEQAFYNCNFSSIYMNDNLKELGPGAFACNKNLSAINKTIVNKNFIIDDEGGLYSSDYEVFYMLPMNSTATDYYINDHTLYIEHYAFIDNKSLKTIHINRNLLRIGRSAFEGIGLSNNNQKETEIYFNCQHVPNALENAFARSNIRLYVSHELKKEYIKNWVDLSDYISDQIINVSFYDDDELIANENIYNFSSINLPKYTKEVEGYTFAGWELNDNFIPSYVVEYYIESNNNRDIKFYAKLVPND